MTAEVEAVAAAAAMAAAVSAAPPPHCHSGTYTTTTGVGEGCYTCEAAAFFHLYHVTSRLERFDADLKLVIKQDVMSDEVIR